MRREKIKYKLHISTMRNKNCPLESKINEAFARDDTADNELRAGGTKHILPFHRRSFHRTESKFHYSNIYIYILDYNNNNNKYFKYNIHAVECGVIVVAYSAPIRRYIL